MVNANPRGRRFEVRLSDEEKSPMMNGLERLLETFERDEIPPKRFAKVMLEDPTLLLAQHRSFRIFRREFFCPIQDYRPINRLHHWEDWRPTCRRFTVR
jgi:hypothetical protein